MHCAAALWLCIDCIMRIVVAVTASSAVLMQVARQQDPQQDAAKVVAVREAVGHSIVLRADANRKWSLNQAVAFGHAVRGANLQVSAEPFHVLLALVAHTGDVPRAALLLRCCMNLWLCCLDTNTCSCQNGCTCSTLKSLSKM